MRLLTLLAILSLCIAAASSQSIANEKRPNILFALADDWGWPHAGSYGDETANTPTFDRLADEGALFLQAYVSTPSCTASRNSIITGRDFYLLEEGANLWSTLDRNQPNFMYLLREYGYEIGHFRKAWGPGVYEVGGYSEHPCGPETNFKQFLQNRDSSKPFCFWFGTTDPHRNYEEGSGIESGIDPKKIHLPQFLPDNEIVRSDLADYYFEVERWDREVGEAIALLEAAGELENTIVVMTGDHGMPFPRCKANLYDWGVRVPLAIRWGDKVEAAQRIEKFVSFTDLAPTFLDAAGVRLPREMTGHSLLPLVSPGAPDASSHWRSSIVFGRERHTTAQVLPSVVGYPSRAIRTEDWLLILNLEPSRWPAGAPSMATHPYGTFPDCDLGPTKTYMLDHRTDPEVAKYFELCFEKRPAVELYDCNADPDQINNLATVPGNENIVRKLTEQLTAYLEQSGDPRFTEKPVRFDNYPYRAPYHERYLREKGFAPASEKATDPQ